MAPRGWTPEQEEENYQRYRADKVSQGLDPREKDDYLSRVGFYEEIERRGNHFRDVAWQELGLREEDSWKKERYQKTSLGARYQDIGNEDLFRAWEFKVAGGIKSDVLTQFDKDQESLDQGWEITWAVRDGSKLDRESRERAQQLARDYPGQFRYVDLNDEKSIQDFARERSREAEALRRTADRFDREEAARSQSPQAEEAVKLSQAGFAKSPTAINHVPHPHPDAEQESVRTTPAAEVAVRHQRAQGNVINGPAIHSAGHPGRGAGIRRGEGIPMRGR
jgi:hypothetical protein